MFSVFESASGRAKAATTSLKVILGIAVAMSLINVMTVISPPDMESLSSGQINPFTALLLMASGLLGIAFLIALLVTAILFLMWLHRAYKNLHAFGVQTEHSPGWVVGYWFIPIISLFRPYQKVNELFEKSDTLATQFRCNNQDADSSVVGWWWACYLISNFISYATFKMSYRGTTSDDIVFASAVEIVSDILYITAAVLIIKIINTIDERQESCASAIMQNQYPNQYGYR